MKNMTSIETLARHREKHFFIPDRMEKSPKFETFFKHEKKSSEKYFWKFLGEKISNFFWQKIEIFQNLIFDGKCLIFGFLTIFDF